MSLLWARGEMEMEGYVIRAVRSVVMMGCVCIGGNSCPDSCSCSCSTLLSASSSRGDGGGGGLDGDECDSSTVSTLSCCISPASPPPLGSQAYKSTNSLNISLVSLGTPLTINGSPNTRKALLSAAIGLPCHASSYTRFEEGYRDIANRLKLHGSDPKVDILQLVSQWLQDDRNGSWLLILDNTDDANMSTYTVAQRRRDFPSTRFEIHSTDFEWLPACTQKLNRKKLLENTNL
jgi:hypothetical protein